MRGGAGRLYERGDHFKKAEPEFAGDYGPFHIQHDGRGVLPLRGLLSDAVIGHESSLKLYTDEYPDNYRYLNMSVCSDAVGVAFKPGGDAVLAERLTQTLLEMREDGTTALL